MTPKPSLHIFSFFFVVVGLLWILGIGSSCVFAQDPLPEFFGVYALQDGKLIELKEDPNLNDFSPTVKFVIFVRGIGTEILQNKMFFLPPDKPKEIGTNEFKGWDEFYKQSQAFNAALEMAMQYGVPANAIEVPFRVGPYGGNNEMMRVVPAKELPPGYYQLLKGARFWIKRAEVQQLYNQASPSAKGGVAKKGAAQPAAAKEDAAKVPATAGVKDLEKASPEQLFEIADGYMTDRSWSNALDIYNRVAPIKADEPRALQGQALSHYMLGNFIEGNTAAEKLLASGAPFVFPIAHFHAMTTCTGMLTVQRGKMAFTSGKGDGFEVGPKDLVAVEVRNLAKGFAANEKLPDYPVLVVRWRSQNGKESSYQMLPYLYSKNPNLSGKNFTSAFPMDSSDVLAMRNFEQSVLSLIQKHIK